MLQIIMPPKTPLKKNVTFTEEERVIVLVYVKENIQLLLQDCAPGWQKYQQDMAWMKLLGIMIEY